MWCGTGHSSFFRPFRFSPDGWAGGGGAFGGLPLLAGGGPRPGFPYRARPPARRAAATPGSQRGPTMSPAELPWVLRCQERAEGGYLLTGAFDPPLSDQEARTLAED